MLDIGIDQRRMHETGKTPSMLCGGRPHGAGKTTFALSDEMKKAVAALQAAVDEEMERKAKLGYKAVIGDKYGKPKLVSAKYLVRKRRAARSSTAASD